MLTNNQNSHHFLFQVKKVLCTITKFNLFLLSNYMFNLIYKTVICLTKKYQGFKFKNRIYNTTNILLKLFNTLNSRFLKRLECLDVPKIIVLRSPYFDEHRHGQKKQNFNLISIFKCKNFNKNRWFVSASTIWMFTFEEFIYTSKGLNV